MIRYIITLTIIHLGTCVIAQTPGNLGTTNLTAWFMPDALALGNVTSWTTTFPIGASATTVTDASAPYPLATNTPVGNVSNYNTTLEFTANTTTNLKALASTASPNFLNNINSSDQGTFFCAYLFPTATSNDHLILYNESSLDAIQVRNLGANGMLALGLTGNSSNGARRWVEGFVPSILSYKGNKSGASTMNLYDRSWESTTASGSGSTGPTGLYFGVKPGIGTSPLNGYLHEVIFYNTDLTNLEIGKVNSYLAIKYGATLLSTGGGTQGDYIATNGNTIWSANTSLLYHNDVVGIARDDNQGLLQKQSHSYDDTTRIYLNSLATTNSANAGTFVADRSFVMIGHNTDKMCATVSSNLEIPGTCGLYSRLEREWKVTNTNLTENFNLDITLNTCANQGLVNINELRLLVDDDGDFSNGGTTCYFNGDGTGISFSYSNPTITISNISNAHIPLNATQYITIASFSQTTPLPIELTQFTLICNQEEVNVNWTTETEFNNDYFTIERSRDATNFENLAIVKGSGTSTSQKTYSWIDEDPLSGTCYYRLSQTNFDGSTKIYQTQSTNCNENDKVLLYPNPFENEITITTQYSGTIELIDITGKVLLESSFEAGETTLLIDQLSPGSYVVRVRQVHGNVQNIKLLKIK